MKRLLIAAAVGSVIVFMWQFLSWSLLGIHKNQMAYSDKQDAVLAAFEEIGLTEGAFYMPAAPPGVNEQEFMQSNMGKPWARVSYFKANETNMGLNMFRGWFISFVSVFFLAYILNSIPGINMRTAVVGAIAIGLIGWMNLTYQESIWFETDSMPQLLDVFIQWGLTGAWLGYFLPRGNNS